MADSTIGNLTLEPTPLATHLIELEEPVGPVSRKATLATVVVDSLMTFSDITTGNVSTTKHGFVPKAPNDATKFFDGTGAFSVPSGASLNIGTTTITSGTSGRVLYDNGGVLGEMTTSGTGTVVMLTASPTTTGTLTGAAANWSGQNTISVAGVASAPGLTVSGSPFAGTGTTSFPQVYINESTATASTTLNTAGTYFGINAHGSGDLMNLMKDGVNRLYVNNKGSLKIWGQSAEFPIEVFTADGVTSVFRVTNTSGDCVSAGLFSSGSGFRATAFGVYIGVAAGQRFVFNNNGIDAYGSNTTDVILRINGVAARTQPLEKFLTSAAGSLGNVSGGCFADIITATSTTHTDGTFDTLSTITFVANALIVNGDKIYFDYTLTVVGHAITTTDVKVAFAGITIFDSTALALGTGTSTIRLKGYISRVTSTTCQASIEWNVSGGSGIVLASADIQTFTGTGTLTGLTLTGTNNLVLSAASASTNAASGDISVVHGTAGITGFGS